MTGVQTCALPISAVIIEDRFASPERISETLREMLDDDRLDAMMVQSKNLAKPNATESIVDEICRVFEVC